MQTQTTHKLPYYILIIFVVMYFALAIALIATDF